MIANGTDLSADEPATIEAGGSRPGVIWGCALRVLRGRLEEQGVPPDHALELGEGAVIACALRYVPRSVDEACDLALDLLGRV